MKALSVGGNPVSYLLGIDIYNARLHGRIAYHEHGCWEWVGTQRDDGYGVVTIHSQLYRVHCLAYELFVGPIPDGMILDHTCHNDSGCAGGSTCPHRACCRPDHLEPVERGENVRRGERKNAHIETCRNGHRRTDENTGRQPSGARLCLECKRSRGRNWAYRNRIGV